MAVNADKCFFYAAFSQTDGFYFCAKKLNSALKFFINKVIVIGFLLFATNFTACFKFHSLLSVCRYSGTLKRKLLLRLIVQEYLLLPVSSLYCRKTFLISLVIQKSLADQAFTMT